MMKLREIVRAYQRKRTTEAHFFKAFENEITEYLSIFDQIAKHSDERIWPVLESIGEELTVRQMNELFEEFCVFPLLQAQLIEAFISFAKACSEVSALRGFMDDLKIYNVLMYDFVYTMKNTYVAENRVEINGKYYRFYQTYERELFGGIKAEDVEDAVREMRGYVKKMKHYLEKTAFIKRNTRKKYVRNMRLLATAAERMHIRPTSIVDLRAYLPRALLPLAVMIEDLM